MWTVTGGLGGLGLRGAALLSSIGVTRLVLSSRSGRVAHEGQGLEEWLCALAVSVVVVSCDSADRAQAVLLQKLAPSHGGLLHAAGVIDDQLLLRTTATSLEFVLASKALAAINIHTSKMQWEMAALVLFSSGAATFGSVGQATYTAANTALDSLALCRRGCGLAASSLQPSNVSELGMARAANDAGRHQRSWSLGLEEYANALGYALACSGGIYLPMPSDLVQIATAGDATAI